MTSQLWWATLRPSSPRYSQWREILGCDDVPLMAPQSILGVVPDKTSPLIEVYILDLKQLTSEQTDRLVAAMAIKFKTTEEAVRDGIMHDGFPVRAVDVTVCFDGRAFA